jgi:uncharacterized protein (TIGR00255 family)
MTGFGRGDAQQDGITWLVECSSVNRKQLEIVINLPRELGELEIPLRNLIAGRVSRGRVQVMVRADTTSSEGSAVVRIDEALAAQYLAGLRALGANLQVPDNLSLAEIAKLPGVVQSQTQQIATDEAAPAITAALEQALAQMLAMRETEGRHLRTDIEQRLAALEVHLENIKEKAPTVPEHHRKQLHQRLEESGLPIPLEDERLIKEIALFADRTDLSEEIARASSHFSQFRAYLTGKEPAGRPLDFLVQEFFREFNTMGSKASNAEIAHHVVAAKTELEKIREQLQNAE